MYNTNSTFSISLEDLTSIVHKYESRKVDEDLNFIRKQGGIDEILSGLKTSQSLGIDDNEEEISQRIIHFSSNKFKEKSYTKWVAYIIESLKDPLLIVLICVSILKIAIGFTPLTYRPGRDWMNGLTILLSVLIVVLVSSITCYQKDLKFKELSIKKSQMIKVTVKRAGKLKQINPEELVVGDICKIKDGAFLYADGLLIDSMGLFVDESFSLGYSKAREKKCLADCIKRKHALANTIIESNPFLLPTCVLVSGSSVVSGEGWMVIIAVGNNSTKRRMRVQDSNEIEIPQTNIDIRIERIMKRIGIFTILSSATVCILLVIGIINYINKYQSITIFEDDTDRPITLEMIIIKELMQALYTSISILIVAMPEGLPLAISIAYAFSVNEMMKQNSVIREMSACETLGYVNCFVTDRTGILTKNNKKIVSFFDCNETTDVKAKDKRRGSNDFNSNYVKMLALNLSLSLTCLVDESDSIFGESPNDKASIDFLHMFGVRVGSVIS